MKTQTQYLILALGFMTVITSWFSIRPASVHRYYDLVDREELIPNDLTVDEWLMSKEDQGLSAIFLLIIGVPLFLFITICALVASSAFDWIKPTPVFVGVCWICVGCFLHTLVWIH